MEKRERACKNLLSLSGFVKVEKSHSINAMFSSASLSIERLDDEVVNITPIRPLFLLLHFVMLTVQKRPHEDLKSVVKDWNNQSAEKMTEQRLKLI